MGNNEYGSTSPREGAIFMASRVSSAAAAVVSGERWPTETKVLFHTHEGQPVTAGVIWGEDSDGVPWLDGDRWFWQMAGDEQRRLVAESCDPDIDHCQVLVKRYVETFEAVAKHVDAAVLTAEVAVEVTQTVDTAEVLERTLTGTEVLAMFRALQVALHVSGSPPHPLTGDEHAAATDGGLKMAKFIGGGDSVVLTRKGA